MSLSHNEPHTRGFGYSHERVVDQRPSSRPLQRVVDQVLDPPPADVIPLNWPGVVQGGLGQQADADSLRAPLEVVPAGTHQQQGSILVHSSGALVQ